MRSVVRSLERLHEPAAARSRALHLPVGRPRPVVGRRGRRPQRGAQPAAGVPCEASQGDGGPADPDPLVDGYAGAVSLARSRSTVFATSTREETPSFMKMLRTCDSIVLSLRNNAAAISRFVMRSVTRPAISCSRFVSAP